MKNLQDLLNLLEVASIDEAYRKISRIKNQIGEQVWDPLLFKAKQDQKQIRVDSQNAERKRKAKGCKECNQSGALYEGCMGGRLWTCPKCQGECVELK